MVVVRLDCSHTCFRHHSRRPVATSIQWLFTVCPGVRSLPGDDEYSGESVTSERLRSQRTSLWELAG